MIINRYFRGFKQEFKKSYGFNKTVNNIRNNFDGRNMSYYIPRKTYG